MKKYILVMFLLVYHLSYSQWELLYPNAPNTTISSFAVSGNNVIAGSTKRGVFLSTDKGYTWANKRTGLDIKPVEVNSLTISENYMFAATADSGVYRSSNYGDSWEQINNGLYLLNVKSIAAKGSNILAGINGFGIFFSSNNGNNWIQKNNGLSNLNINTIAIAGENIFIGTQGGGIYYSSNMGSDWNVKNNGFEFKADSIVHSIDIDGNIIVAGTGSGIFVSTDLGENWVRKHSEGESTSVIVKGTNIYAISSRNVIKSNDLGNEWIVYYNNGLSFQYNYNDSKYSTMIPANTLALIDDNIVIAGTTSNGLYISTDAGDFFEAKALVDYNIKSIVSDGKNMFVSSYSPNYLQDYGGGIYTSSNMGNSWNRSGFQGEMIQSMVLKDDTLFVLHYIDGIYFTTDLGLSWKVKETTSFPEYVGLRSLVIDGNNWAIATVLSGVLLSTDSGNSWEVKNDGFDTGIYSIAFDGENIFVGTGGSEVGKGVFLSTDLGDSFIQKGLEDLNIYKIKVSGNYVFAGTNDGFYRSTDYGETWEQKFKDNISTSILAFELYNGNLIINVSGNNAENKVFVSTDMGDNWTRKDETKDGSDTPFNSPGNIVQDFSIDGEYIYAVVSPSMIFKSLLNDLIPTSINDGYLDKNKLVLFPNPASDFINISIDSESGLLTREVQILDLLGLIVSKTELTDGNNRIDISNLPRGTYFIKVGDKVEKFVKM